MIEKANALRRAALLLRQAIFPSGPDATAKAAYLVREIEAALEIKRWPNLSDEPGAKDKTGRRLVMKTCAECGMSFYGFPRNCANFCSRTCSKRYARELPKNDVQRDCVVCLKTFTINKFSVAKTCGQECRTELMRKGSDWRLLKSVRTQWKNQTGQFSPEPHVWKKQARQAALDKQFAEKKRA